jgi:Icc-related predicted phosphoesterase
MSLKIWHISDSHSFHLDLKIPENIDMVIFSGDCSNPQELIRSEFEIRQFIDWFSSLNIKYKIFVAGNHDCALEAGYVNKQDFTLKNIIFLENESIEIEGLKIWGSPCTPTFGTGWAWNIDRDKLPTLWATIPDNTDIIITHGPSFGDLDLAHRYNYNPTFGGFIDTGEWENCGCIALKQRIINIQPKLVCFGHIHNNGRFINAGTKIENNIIYSNGSVLTDSKFGRGLSSNGNIFEFDGTCISLVSLSS